MDEQTKPKINWWKVGFIIALVVAVFFIGVSLSGHIVKAAPAWPFDKAKTCSLLNISGSDCDSYWCEQIQGNSWNATDSVCIQNIYIINETQNITYIQNISYVNVTTNITANLTDNSTAMINYSELYTKEEVDNITRALRDNLVLRIENVTAPTYYGDSNKPIDPWPYVIGLGIILAFCGWTIYSGQKNAAKAVPIRSPNKGIKLQSFQGKPAPAAPREEPEEQPEEEEEEEKPAEKPKKAKPKKREQEVFDPKTKQTKKEVIDDEAENKEEDVFSE